MRLFSTVQISVELKCLFPNASKAMQNLKHLKLISPKAWNTLKHREPWNHDVYDDECLCRVEKDGETWQPCWIGFEKHWVGSANRSDFATLQPLGTLIKARFQLCDQLLLGICGQVTGKCIKLETTRGFWIPRLVFHGLAVSHARRCTHVISWSAAKERPRHWRLDWALVLRKDSVLAHLAPRKSMQSGVLASSNFKPVPLSPTNPVANLWRLCNLVWPGPGPRALQQTEGHIGIFPRV